MSEVTRILNSMESGEAGAAEELLPLVYEELRRLAASKMAQEKPGQTLQATALVHEAWLRLVGNQLSQPWENRGHFFSAASSTVPELLRSVTGRPWWENDNYPDDQCQDAEGDIRSNRGCYELFCNGLV